MNKYMLVSASIIEAETTEGAQQKLRDKLGSISDGVTLISISDELGARATIDQTPLWPPAITEG